MDIAALSMGLSRNSVANQASVSIMKKVMDTQTQSAQALIQNMSAATSAAPSNHKIDVYA